MEDSSAALAAQAVATHANTVLAAGSSQSAAAEPVVSGESLEESLAGKRELDGVEGNAESAQLAAAAPPALPESLEDDLTGKWRLVRVEGNMNGVAADMGVPWGMRRIAEQAGWGAGKVKHSFAFSSGRVLITGEGPKGTYAQDLLLDGVCRDTVMLSSGAPVKAAARLQGRVLHVDTGLIACRREVVGEELVMQQTSSKSKACCRLFFRRA